MRRLILRGRATIRSNHGAIGYPFQVGQGETATHFIVTGRFTIMVMTFVATVGVVVVFDVVDDGGGCRCVGIGTL